MAWNVSKTELLKVLMGERSELVKKSESITKYGITKSVLQVIGSHIDDASKQAILNELIDDKVAMLVIDKAIEQGSISAMTGIQQDLISNKE